MDQDRDIEREDEIGRSDEEMVGTEDEFDEADELDEIDEEEDEEMEEK